MVISGGAYLGPKEIKYLFIDGGCLRVCLERMAGTYAGGAVLNLDYGKLTWAYSKVFYYDALPERKSGEDDQTYRVRVGPQRNLFDRLRVRFKT
jgi:hypothetical protein